MSKFMQLKPYLNPKHSYITISYGIK